MLCQNCQQDRDEQEGLLYTFYYGNQTGVVYGGRSSRARYKIHGSEKPFLCHECVFAYAMRARATLYRRWSIAFALLSVAAGILALLSTDATMSVILWLLAGLLLAFALSLFLMGWIEKQRTAKDDFAALSSALRAHRGCNLAIAARMDDLTQQGYSAFFTPQRMKRMTHLIRVRGEEKQLEKA